MWLLKLTAHSHSLISTYKGFTFTYKHLWGFYIAKYNYIDQLHTSMTLWVWMLKPTAHSHSLISTYKGHTVYRDFLLAYRDGRTRFHDWTRLDRVNRTTTLRGLRIRICGFAFAHLLICRFAESNADSLRICGFGNLRYLVICGFAEFGNLRICGIL